MYMAPPPPRGTPPPPRMTSSPPSTTKGFSTTTRDRRSGGRRSAGTTGAASARACQSFGNPFASGSTTSGSAVSPPARRPPTYHRPATSAGNATRCPPQRQQAPTGARSAPRWPHAPGPSHPRARTDAQKRSLCTGGSGVHTPPHTAAGAPREPPSCSSKCTCGTPRPTRTCPTCSRPDPRSLPRFAEPAAPCIADGGTGRSTPEPAAGRRRRPSGAG